MTGTEVKILLLKKGIRQSDLARKWDESDVRISRAVNRRANDQRIDALLAKELGITLEDLRRDPLRTALETIIDLTKEKNDALTLIARIEKIANQALTA